MTPHNFNVFVGCLSGNLKDISLDGSLNVTNVRRFSPINKEKITALSWADEKKLNILLACGTKETQSVHSFNTETSDFTHSFKCIKGEGDIVGICNYSKSFLVAKQSGHIICPRSEEENEDEEEKEKFVINAGAKLHRMRQSNTEKKVIATGGLENPLKLFDVEKEKQIFVAKNVRNDFLEMRVPIWISDIGFFPGASKVTTASRYGHIQLYDTLAQRRPVIDVEIKSESLSSLAVHPSRMQVIVGSGKGILNLIDLRSSGKILNSYKGSAGSITAIAINKVGTQVISVGFDRMLRIHDINTKLLLKKQYLKTRSTSLLIRSEH